MSRLPSLGPRGEGWFVLQLLLLALIVAAAGQFAGSWSGMAGLAGVALGAALMAGGLLLVAVAALALGRAASPLPKPVSRGSLARSGLYRYVRHPIYLGVILSAMGYALIRASLPALALCALLALLLDLKARREESWLRQRYPEYEDYARRTRRFIPWLY
ncbi:MAG TPA: NnrU family protein [Candidatus Limnocylindria bacterium]|nr:NnrU family protein [Candidatus Limnocylindria bacterium]